MTQQNDYQEQNPILMVIHFEGRTPPARRTRVGSYCDSRTRRQNNEEAIPLLSVYGCERLGLCDLPVTSDRISTELRW